MEVNQQILQRGPDCFGVSVFEPNSPEERQCLTYKKNSISRWEENLTETLKKGGKSVVGLCNFRGIPTSEVHEDADDLTIQPYSIGRVSVVHNGLLANDIEMSAKYHWSKVMKGSKNDIDTYLFCHIIHAITDGRKNYKKEERFHKWAEYISEVEGSFAVVGYDENIKELYFARNFRGLYFASWSFKGHDYLVWSSEDQFPNKISAAEISIREMPPYTNFVLPIRYLADDSSITASSWLQKRFFGKTPSYAKQNCAVVFSGGMDSTVCATLAARDYSEVHLLHFTYGAKAQKPEIRSVRAITKFLQEKYPEKKIILEILDLSYLKTLGGSTLIDSLSGIAQGEEGIETVHEWVPARNTLMIAMAASYCDRHHIGEITLGLNMEEGGVFCLSDHPNNTIRLWDGSAKHISEVKIGDVLKGWDDEKAKFAKTTVTKTHTRKSNDVYRLELHSGRKWTKPVQVRGFELNGRWVEPHVRKPRVEKPTIIEATGDHHFYVKGKGFTKVKDMQKGDIIIHMADLTQKERLAKKPPEFDRTGEINPMQDHYRGRKCWCGKFHAAPNPEKISKGVRKVLENNPMIIETHRQNKLKWYKNLSLKERSELAQMQSKGKRAGQRRRLKETGYAHHMQEPKYRRNLTKKLRLAIDEGRFNPSIFNNKKINGLEKKFEKLFQKYSIPLNYVGDGQVWFTAKNGKKMNPDFYDKTNKMVVEITEGSNFFHSAQEKRRRREAFEKLGYDFHYLTDKDIKPMNLSKTISLLKGSELVNGMVVTKKQKIRKENIQTYDVTCEPHHNYLVGKSNILSHNCDNSIEYYQSMEKTLLLGTQARPRMTMPLGNMMKSHIWKLGREINAPFDISWSCYLGGKKRCGQCGPCEMRQRAAALNGEKDMVKYECESVSAQEIYNSYKPKQEVKPEPRKSSKIQVSPKLDLI